MKQYRAQVIGDRYPMDFACEATDWPAAAQRIARQWKQHRIGKGSRTNTLTIKIVRIDPNPRI
jgi:hypothetical protein